MDDNLELIEKEMLDDISSFLEHVEPERSSLIPVLQKIQAKYSYLSSDAIKLIGKRLDLTSSEVYGVATFYNQFRFNPPGKHRIKVCMGTACHVKGGDIILENFERKLNIKTGETTRDREFSIDKVACIGCCALAPAVVVDEKIHGYVAPSKVEGIMLGFEIEKEMNERKERSSTENSDGEIIERQ